jgi:CTP:phosphocholine cytidylyltransferase-like protein
MELNTLELKNDLHTLVTNTNDENLLFRVKEYFTELKNKDDWWHLLSKEQKNKVEIGTKQLENNLRFSNDEVRVEINKLLHRK